MQPGCGLVGERQTGPRVQPALHALLVGLLGRDHIGGQGADPQHRAGDPPRQTGDVDPAVVDGELVAGALLELVGRRGRGCRFGEGEHPDVAVSEGGVGGPDQHRMAGGEQYGTVLAGDVGIGGDDQLGRQVEVIGQRFGEHDQRAVTDGFGQPAAVLDVTQPEAQARIHCSVLPDQLVRSASPRIRNSASTRPASIVLPSPTSSARIARPRIRRSTVCMVASW